MKDKDRINKQQDCPIEKALDIIASKWTLMILRSLVKENTLRFGQLRKSLDGISTKTLTQKLRHLESHGIIKRKAYATIPPKVEYSLTDSGKDLKNVVSAIAVWYTKWY